MTGNGGGYGDDSNIIMVERDNTFTGSGGDESSQDMHAIGLDQSRFIRINELPYDPFDFDTIQNFETAKSDFSKILYSSSLYKSFIDFKEKRSSLRKTTTQLVLEVKKPVVTVSSSSDHQASQPSTTAEKFAIKENQSVNLGQVNCDITLKNNAVSRKHAMIENRSTGCTVQDLGSSCGTFVRIRNQHVTLSEGSIFECGF